MKKAFEYVGLFVLAIFSFYYTEKVVKMVNENDPLMEEISDYAKTVNAECIEGYTSDEGVVLGVNGMIVDEESSYKNMKGFGFNEELLVFESDECSVNKDKLLDKYIIRGNESKNSVSVIVMVNDGSLIKEFVNTSKKRGVKINFAMSGSTLETYKNYFETLYKEGYDLLYSGNDKVDFEKFESIIKDYNNKNKFYCLHNGLFDIKELCQDKEVNSIKSEYIYTKDILLNTKSTLTKGNIYVYKENKNVLEEFSSTLNHIKGKGIDIITIKELLD